MRLFFALWPEAKLVAGLSALAQDAARQWGGRATRAETVHLTLAFLGEVEAERLPWAEEAATEVRVEAFSLVLDKLGYWPHNHILWAGCSREEKTLQFLATSLCDRLRQRGFKLESRRFSPHLTLVRKMLAKPLNLPAFSATVWNCREFVLMQSVPSGRGVEYKKLASWRLAS